jgi:response regulator RpfG family c-di-GMP phosphodiesterase
MDIAMSELDNINRQLMGLERPKKPKMLVVDDEPDNLDLLYRTFRRDFNVLRADSGMAALDILSAEGEVAVIISDQRMPEMKGTEFLSKTVPQFPNTVRIILTGFTDVEDLVEAINSGQVYKYITKPWDPNELKVVVQRAAETYEVFNQRTEELLRAQTQTLLLSAIMQVIHEADSVKTSLEPIATAFGKAFSASGCVLQVVEESALGVAQGSYAAEGLLQHRLEQNPMVKEAIATQTMQVIADVAADSALAQLPDYADTGIQSHLVVPVIFKNTVLGVLSLQWKHPYMLQGNELTLLQLSVQQAALALACNHQALVVA